MWHAFNSKNMKNKSNTKNESFIRSLFSTIWSRCSTSCWKATKPNRFEAVNCRHFKCHAIYCFQTDVFVCLMWIQMVRVLFSEKKSKMKEVSLNQTKVNWTQTTGLLLGRSNVRFIYILLKSKPHTQFSTPNTQITVTIIIIAIAYVEPRWYRALGSFLKCIKWTYIEIENAFPINVKRDTPKPSLMVRLLEHICILSLRVFNFCPTIVRFLFLLCFFFDLKLICQECRTKWRYFQWILSDFIYRWTHLHFTIHIVSNKSDESQIIIQFKVFTIYNS